MAVDWVNDTGYKRSTYDMESERRPYKPQKASANSTGFTSQIAGLMTDGIMEKAMADKMASMEQGPAFTAPSKDEEAAEAAAEADEDRAAGGDAEDDLEALRARRRQQMKDAQLKQQKYKQLGHGDYEEITEDDFLKTVTSSERCVVHFYHRHFERCKIVDMHLGKCAKKFFGTRFVKLDSEKAPFFVEKLKVRTLPCVVFFVDGVAKGRQVGFDGLGGDEFKTLQLAGKMRECGGIEEDFDPEDEDF
uniref:Thioredoxin domain-containing protein n=1 Tax=Alexandrium andersonii TaxID=327968 RepID=A0A7S2BP56_9DINO